MDVYFFIPLLWFLLFFGACIVPPATGIIISCVERKYQSTSSSISQLLINLTGYFLSPLFSASIMDQFSNKKEGMKWG